MKISSLVLAISALVVSNIAFAKTATVEEQFVQKLSQCDASLYEFMYKHRKTLRQYAPIEHKNGIAYFKLSSNSEKAQVTFKKPMIVNGVEFTGFYNQYFSLPFAEPLNSYFWGLTTQTEAETVVKKLPTLQLTAETSHIWAGTAWIIEDVKNSTQWIINENASSGTMPVKNSVEKVFFLEKVADHSMLSCTIQGYPNDKIIYSIRPDLKGQ